MTNPKAEIILSLLMDEDHRGQLVINPEIAKIMDDESAADERTVDFYATEALIFALSIMAGKRLEKGEDSNDVFMRIMNTISERLEKVIPGLIVQLGTVMSDGKVDLESEKTDTYLS